MSRRSLYLAIGYSCNHSCVFCPRGLDGIHSALRNDAQLLESLDDIFRVREISHVTVSGGEPTLQPCFFDVMSHLAGLGIDVGILSNADRFSDIAIVRELADVFPISRLSVTTSIHSRIPELHERITGALGSFSRSIAGLHNLESLNIRVNIKHIVNRYSYRDMSEFVRWSSDEFPGVSLIDITGMDLCGMKDSARATIAVPNMEAGCFLEEAADAYEKTRGEGFRGKLNFSDLPLCCVDPFYWKYFALRDSDKSGAYVAPTVNGRIIAHTELESDCGTFSSECAKCGVREICPGLWRTHYDYFGCNDTRAVVLYKA